MGESIGHGDGKTAFAVLGDPDHAIIVYGAANDTWHDVPEHMVVNEKGPLDRLAALGVPVMEIVEIGPYRGKGGAIIARRYETSDRNPDWSTKRFELLNEETIADLERIKSALRTRRHYVSDLQCIFSKDGHAVVFDARVKNETELAQDSWMRNETAAVRAATFERLLGLNETKLDHLILLAEDAILARKTDRRARLALLPGAEDERLAPFFRENAVDVSADDHDPDELGAALIRYLESGPTTESARTIAADLREGRLTLEMPHARNYITSGQEGNTVDLMTDLSFPEIASDLVGKAGGDRAAFLEAKGVPLDLLVRSAETVSSGPLTDARAIGDLPRAAEEPMDREVERRGGLITPLESASLGDAVEVEAGP
jgi:hypothetical protein